MTRPIRRSRNALDTSASLLSAPIARTGILEEKSILYRIEAQMETVGVHGDTPRRSILYDPLAQRVPEDGTSATFSMLSELPTSI